MEIRKKLEHALELHSNKSVFLFIGNKKSLYSIIIIASVVITPLALKNYLLGYNLLAYSLITFVLATLINIYSLHKRSRLLLSVNIMTALLTLSLFFTFYYLGMKTVYWVYPISIALIFILYLKSALFFNLLIWLVASSFSYIELPFWEAVRISASLLVTIIVSCSILIHINKLNQRLKNESIKDPMTGAYNRRELSIHLEHCLALKQRSNINSSILFFDLDHFKVINDTYGHDAGDEVITYLVKIINNHSRESDMLFRVGGEEFILLMNNTEVENALLSANKLREQIKDKQVIEGHPITVSIGVCGSFRDTSKDEWIKYADMALYEAKQSGRDQVKAYQT